jgi:hypothetical protein
MSATVELPAPDRAKLGKLLGLLGSDHAGERDAAGLAAHRLLQSRGLTWPAVLTPPRTREPLQATWRQTCAACLERRGSLRPCEIGFLTDLQNFRRVSSKQRYILQEIANRVLRSGGSK